LTKIVAHRGASLEAPENSLAAFEKAIEVGADRIEFDVRRDSRGRLVITHDPIRGSSAKLPTLEETLRLTQGRIHLDVELKEPDCEQDAIHLLLRYFPLSEFWITSFHPEALRATRAIHPGIRIGLIFAVWNRGIVTSDADFLAPHYRLLKKAENIGKPLLVWTVDDLKLTRRLFQHPLVEAIVTNDPRQALALRAELLSH
jgi:glycerophosphoryl diester phosphodiesterase